MAIISSPFNGILPVDKTKRLAGTLMALNPFPYQFIGLHQKSRFAELAQTAYQKAIRVTGLYVHQVIVLYAVDIFLCDHGGTDFAHSPC